MEEKRRCDQSSGFSRRPLWGIAGRVMSKTDPSAPNQGADATPPANAAGDQVTDNSPADLATAARKSAAKGVWTGAAVGIGSAAIVAALLYTRKKNG